MHPGRQLLVALVAALVALVAALVIWLRGSRLGVAVLNGVLVGVVPTIDTMRGGVREREWGTFPAPRDGRIVFDGGRRCWMHRGTREAVPASLLERICRSLRAER